jgi:hypothetical protein
MSVILAPPRNGEGDRSPTANGGGVEAPTPSATTATPATLSITSRIARCATALASTASLTCAS